MLILSYRQNRPQTATQLVLGVASTLICCGLLAPASTAQVSREDSSGRVGTDLCENTSSPPEPPRLEVSIDPHPITINSITVTGSTVFDADTLARIINESFKESLGTGSGTDLDLVALSDRAANAITEHYVERGYLTSRVEAVKYDPDTRAIEFSIIEGSLENIEIEGIRHIRLHYLCRRLELATGPPLNVSDLEDRLRVLRLDPLFDNVEASLRPGDGRGQSVLAVRVNEADRIGGSVEVNNYSPPSVGSEQFAVELEFQNFTGRGDRWDIEYERAFRGGAESLDVAYAIPVNPRDGTVRIRAEFARNAVVQDPFDDLDIEGDFETVDLRFRPGLFHS